MKKHWQEDPIEYALLMRVNAHDTNGFAEPAR